MEKENELLSAVIQFIYRERWKYRKKITLETTLEGDLKITGDDGDDFMNAFFKEFKIDHSDFDLGKHFGNEGFDPIGLSYLIKRLFWKDVQIREHDDYYDIQVKDLVSAIKRGKWIAPPIS